MKAGTSGTPRAIRLQRYLSRAGVASRRDSERLIREGRVKIDGSVVTELGTRVVPGEQVVSVDGELVGLSSSRWLVVYKPVGYLTTRRDTHGRRTVYELLPEEHRELYYVGRLDRETEGLLIFTNDGEAAHRLLHPSYEIPRRYRVEVEGAVEAATIERLRDGIALEDGLARAEEVRVVSRRQTGRSRAETTELSLTLREGRKREVRRMLAELELPVRRLVRIGFGPIEIGDLEQGRFRELGAEEVEALRAAVGLE